MGVCKCSYPDIKDVKKRLKDYVDMGRNLENQWERINRIQSQLCDIGAPELSDMPKGPHGARDKISDLASMKIDLEAEADDLSYNRVAMRDAIEYILNAMEVSSQDERDIIRMRYIDEASWGEVTKMLFGSKLDYEERFDSYKRRTFNIHGAALAAMAKFLKTTDVHDFISSKEEPKT